MADTNSLQIPISAKFDTRAVEQAVSDMTKRINKLGETVAALNKHKFNPVDRAAEQDIRRIGQQFEVLKRTNPELRRRLGASGQAGASFADVDFAKVYQSPAAMGRIFQVVTQGTAFGGRFQAPQPVPTRPSGGGGGAGGGGGGGGGAGGGGNGGGGGGNFPGQGIVNAGLNAVGPAGRVASGALGAGMSGGLMAGAGALLGGLAALGVGKAVGAVMDKLGDAQDESMGYDTLKRMLGDVNVGFNALRDSLRSSADALNTNYNEALKLGDQFARLSGATNGAMLGRDVRVAGGLARSLGLDMGQGVGAMAQFRLSRVTSNDQDSKRLALLIGEAVGRVGFAKADELLAAVTAFTAQQTRQGMASANVGGYLASLSNLAGTGRAGLDVGGAAALLGRANSAIVGGGAAGEAGQNFLFATLGRANGLSPVQTRILQQKGLFGTGSDAFGPGSLYAQYVKRYGGKMPGAGGSGVQNIESILGGLEQQYGGSPDMMAAAAANLLGLNESQAMAVMMYGRGGALGGIEGRLKKSGVSLGQLSDTGIGALARINTGDASVLDAQAASLRARTGRDALSDSERERLNSVMAKGSLEDIRDVLTQLTATREQEMTEGKATRDSIEGVARETQKFATALIPVANTIRDGIIAIASKLAPDSNFVKGQKEYEAISKREQLLSKYSPAGLEAFDAETAKILADPKNKGKEHQIRLTRELQRKNMEMMGPQEQLRAGIRPGGSSVDALIGAIMMQESGGRRFDKNGNPLSNPNSTALGEMQVLDGTAANPGFGITPAKPGDLGDRARVGRELLAKYMELFGGDQSKAAAAYKAGYGATKDAIKNGGDNWLDVLESSEMAQGHGTVKGYVQGVKQKIELEIQAVDKKTKQPLGSVTTTVAPPAPTGTK